MANFTLFLAVIYGLLSSNLNHYIAFIKIQITYGAIEMKMEAISFFDLVNKCALHDCLIEKAKYLLCST